MPSTRSRPLHERWQAWGWLRAALRRGFVGVVGRTFATDDGRSIATDAASSLGVRHPRELLGRPSMASPYPDLGAPAPGVRPSDRDDVIIITGRFRSGSTLMWNLFRQAGGFTSYYEPLNEARWFDPTARHRVDPTHRNVEEYWREYDGLEVLGRYYDERWIRRDLLMDADAWAPDLRRYVDTLIERAPGRPVLQFNRIDFRLPWFRRHYPRARYLHIYRHPRDQWCSTLLRDADAFTRDRPMAEFGPYDGFYLRMWAEDLKYHFPFLDERRVEHPYPLFYFIWKLSYLFAREYCDHSVRFEDLVRQPDREVPELFRAVGVDSVDLPRLKEILVLPDMGRWRRYADEGWFRAHEASCDEVITDFLASPEGPLPRVSPLGPADRCRERASGCLR